VVDACDAGDRPYGRARAPEEALAEIRRGSGPQCDPAVVEPFTARPAEHWDRGAGVADDAGGGARVISRLLGEGAAPRLAPEHPPQGSWDASPPPWVCSSPSRASPRTSRRLGPMPEMPASASRVAGRSRASCRRLRSGRIT